MLHQSHKEEVIAMGQTTPEYISCRLESSKYNFWNGIVRYANQYQRVSVVLLNSEKRYRFACVESIPRRAETIIVFIMKHICFISIIGKILMKPSVEMICWIKKKGNIWMILLLICTVGCTSSTTIVLHGMDEIHKKKRWWQLGFLSKS